MKFLLAASTALLSTAATTAFAPATSKVSLKNARNTPIGKNAPLFMADDDDWAAPKSAMIGGAGVNNAGEPPFEIRGFSLGNLVIGAGIGITVLSFADYLSTAGGDGLSMSGVGFVYGIPIFLAG